MRNSVTLDQKWKRDLCIGAENPARNFDLSIVDDMNVSFGRDDPPGLKLGHLFHKCWQMRIQSSRAFASHAFYRLAELFRTSPATLVEARLFWTSSLSHVFPLPA